MGDGWMYWNPLTVTPASMVTTNILQYQGWHWLSVLDLDLAKWTSWNKKTPTILIQWVWTSILQLDIEENGIITNIYKLYIEYMHTMIIKKYLCHTHQNIKWIWMLYVTVTVTVYKTKSYECNCFTAMQRKVHSLTLFLDHSQNQGFGTQEWTVCGSELLKVQMLVQWMDFACSNMVEWLSKLTLL